MKERVRICRIYHKKHRRMPMVCQKIQHEDQPLIDFGDNMETTDATRRFFCLRLGAAAVGTALNSAHAALPVGYPAKPIRIVGAFPAGQGAAGTHGRVRWHANWRLFWASHSSLKTGPVATMSLA